MKKKRHIKKNGKPVCGVRGKKLQYVDDTHGVSCLRCMTVVER